MASPEHGRSSSSPSVKVSDLRYEGADGSVLRVHLDDGSLFLFDSDHPMAGRVSSRRDSDIALDEEDLEALAAADEGYGCRRKALDLLARAEQCRRGLEAKLSRKGFSRESVSAALDRLEAAGFLDDRRFAESWVRSRLRNRPEGPSKLRGGLMSRGIPGDIASIAVEAVLAEIGNEESADALERAWLKLSRRPGITPEKLTASLVRKGFSVGRVRDLIRSREPET